MTTPPDDTTTPVAAEGLRERIPCPVDHQCEGEPSCDCWCDLHDVPIAECPTFVLVSSWLDSRDKEIERLRNPGDPGDLPAQLAEANEAWDSLAATAAASLTQAADVTDQRDALQDAIEQVRALCKTEIEHGTGSAVLAESVIHLLARRLS